MILMVDAEKPKSRPNLKTNQMKTFINFFSWMIIILIAISVLSLKCNKDNPAPPETNLSLTVTEHPDGGKLVNQVSANFEGAITGTVTPVSVTVEWWWEDGNHENSEMQESEEIIFNSSNVTLKSTIYKAPPNYFLLNYYWVKFTWTDDNGQHEVKTSKAFCTSK